MDREPDGYEDNDDKEGSRSIISRTAIGAKGEAVKSYPQLCGDLVILGGLIRVKDYNYDWKYPKAYISLLMADAPHIDYDWEKKVKWAKDNQALTEDFNLNDLAASFGLNMAKKEEDIYLKDL